MSVINKMLRDLDQRNAPGPDAAGPAGKHAGKGGVKPVGTLPTLQGNASNRAGKSVLKPLLLVGSLGLAAAGAWWWTQSPKAAAQHETVAQPETVAPSANSAAYPWLNDSAAEVHAKKLMAGEVAPQSVAPAVAPVMAPAVAPAASEPANSAASSSASVASASKPQQVPPVASAPAVIAKAELVPSKPPAPAALPATVATAKPVAGPAGAAATMPPPVAAAAPATTATPATTSTTSTSAKPIAAPSSSQPSQPAAASTSAAAPPVVDAGQRQQQAGRDALAQAQTLWSSGSKDAAIDLLQQATTTAERNLSSNPSPAGRQLLVAMVRELTRMELADGRPAAAYEILTRLESVVAGEPDLLAVRANAAQRLGRHQDSINAYRAALQFRPAEQRWLLGSAVSMAALGQTAAAADMAEKARQVGPISKEVQTYLKQAGVPVRE